MVAITINRFVMGTYISMYVMRIVLIASIMMKIRKIQKATPWERSLFADFSRNNVKVV